MAPPAPSIRLGVEGYRYVSGRRPGVGPGYPGIYNFATFHGVLPYSFSREAMRFPARERIEAQKPCQPFSVHDAGGFLPLLSLDRVKSKRTEIFSD